MVTYQKWLFPISIPEAKRLQEEMAGRVLLQDTFGKSLSTIAGMDVSNSRFDPAKMVYAAAVVVSFPTLSLEETATTKEKQPFPYVPGLLGFREAPALIRAYDQLSTRPDLIMVDGHGVSHPRGLGIASHLGVLLDIPTIGVAKSILVGSPQGPLPDAVGSQVPLVWKGKTIAMLLRTKKRCSPLIISAGHRITLETAINVVISCLKGYRLAEPTRQAHLAANACRLSSKAKIATPDTF